MGAHTGRGPRGTTTNPAVWADGTLARTGAAARCGPLGPEAGRDAFETELALLQAEIANAGFVGTVDGAARAQYDRLLREFRDEILERVQAGKLTWQQAAGEAHSLRNDVMELIRARSTPVGRSLAEWMKPNGRTLNELVARKTTELFGAKADFTRLAPEQRNRVYAAIVESAGKSNPRVTARMRTLSRAGRGLLVVSVGVSIYSVATADDPLRAAKREGAVTGAGIAGGVAGGALAGLACGPGAPVCVAVGAFVGGAAAALGVDFLWSD